jgi:glutathione S-transferase
MAETLLLHQMAMSGNCYKVRLVAHQLGLALTLKDYSLHGGETRTPESWQKIPMGVFPCWNSAMAACWRNPVRYFFI